MTENFFSKQGKCYSTVRPDYPNQLIHYLSSLCNIKQSVWDCATGNGQVAKKLAPYFSKVIATDISAQQIHHVAMLSNIEYRVGMAEHSDLTAHSVDLIIAAQAAPWLDIPTFYEEIKRVGKQNAIIALFGFREMICNNPILDKLIQQYIHEIVLDDWPAGKSLNDSQYQSLEFPFEELTPPRFSINKYWYADDVLNLLDSYSGGQAYLERTGQKASKCIREEFIQVWGGERIKRPISIPIYMRLGKIYL